jgi:DnaJ-class molecular chaperone
MTFNKKKAIEEFEKSIGFTRLLTQWAHKKLADWLAEDIECPRCNGSGYSILPDILTCSKCEGKGTIPNLMRFVE